MIARSCAARAAEPDLMKNHVITGGGGIRLHVVEAGKPEGRALVFIHGFSQCWLAWIRQFESELAANYRLIGVDMRGHGLSDKPHNAYADSRLWADDLHAVIRILRLDRPVVCGWSYGPLMILDYIRRYGEAEISGANFVGGVTKLGSEAAAAVLSADFLALVPGLFSEEAEESVRSLGSLLELCYSREVPDQDLFRMLGYNVSVPPYVRQALFSRVFDNDDLLPKLRTPILIMHGTEDAVVKSVVIEQQMARIPGARVERMSNAGHACFWDDAPAYNRSLAAFAASL
jgi:pimeloyl-ACP methyl ester carboxylesterase